MLYCILEGMRPRNPPVAATCKFTLFKLPHGKVTERDTETTARELITVADRLSPNFHALILRHLAMGIACAPGLRCDHPSGNSPYCTLSRWPSQPRISRYLHGCLGAPILNNSRSFHMYLDFLLIKKKTTHQILLRNHFDVITPNCRPYHHHCMGQVLSLPNRHPWNAARWRPLTILL